jgi:hypothetical protein
LNLGTVRGGTDLPIHTIHGHILQYVDSTKYLGLNISKNLSWNTHVDAITKKANNTLAFLRRNIGTSPSQLRNEYFVPCGTPDATEFVDDEFPSSATVWVRSDKKS